MIAAIIQARMGCSRLPGKVLAEVDGRPLLDWQLERIARAGTLDEIVVATSTTRADDPIAVLCDWRGVTCYRGELDDVLSRCHHAAATIAADVVVRLTGNCPLLDPEVIDATVRAHLAGGADFTSSTVPPAGATYPSGMDVEVFPRELLELSWLEARRPSEREHVTFFIWKQPGRFRLRRIDAPEDLSGLRLTVDVPEDLELVRHVLEALYPARPDFGLGDVAAFLHAWPDVALRQADAGGGRQTLKRLPTAR